MTAAQLAIALESYRIRGRVGALSDVAADFRAALTTATRARPAKIEDVEAWLSALFAEVEATLARRVEDEVQAFALLGLDADGTA